MIADFEELGVTIDAEDVARDTGEFSVYPTAWDSICAFLACETQWRAVGVGLGGLLWLGLDYGLVDVVLRRRSCPDQVFDDIQLMEREALEILNGGGT